MGLREAIQKAQRQARSAQATRFVIETDDGEGRTLGVVDERYIRTDEFEAFEGLIVAEVSADGEIEYHGTVV